MAGIDINRTTEGVYLPEELANEVWAKSVEKVFFMSQAEETALPGNGKAVPVLAGEGIVTVAGETQLKPISRPAISNKKIRGNMFQVTIPFSKQFVRDDAIMFNKIAEVAPDWLAKHFDKIIFGTATSDQLQDFDTLADVESVSIVSNVYDGIVDAMEHIDNNGFDSDTLIVAPKGRTKLLKAKDNNGNPLFVMKPLANGSIGEVLGNDVFKTRSAYIPGTAPAGGNPGVPEQLGFLGDMRQAVWGKVGNIAVDIAKEATIEDTDGTKIDLWQRNMVALRLEVEFGFRFKFDDAFVRLTGETPDTAAKKADRKAEK